jgi:hypothetical protein
LRLSRLICIQINFQEATHPCFEVSAIKSDFPSSLPLGLMPAKHDFRSTASLVHERGSGDRVTT